MRLLPSLFLICTYSFLLQAVPKYCSSLIAIDDTVLEWNEIPWSEFTQLPAYQSVQARLTTLGIDLSSVSPGKTGHVVEITEAAMITQVLTAMSDRLSREHHSKRDEQLYLEFCKAATQAKPSDRRKLVCGRYPNLAALGTLGAWTTLGGWVGYFCGITSLGQTAALTVAGLATTLYSVSCVHAREWRSYQDQEASSAANGPLPFIPNPANELQQQFSSRRSHEVAGNMVSRTQGTWVYAELTANAANTMLKVYAFED